MEEERGNRFRMICCHADMLLFIGVVGFILLLIIPLPPFCLDILLCISMALSVMVLLLTFYVEHALELSAFPSILLFLTFFRLSLNIASTRLILTEAEAGSIIDTFGAVVIHDNVMVGILIFLLLTLINFIVVTKGAGRIAEVAARFSLEALPGKQMAIDRELSSGLISQTEAKEGRKKLESESDFYGAMDGASKFVKGDAIAGLVITFINIIGGLVIGLWIKKLSWNECWTTINRLTIGDGLVSQIPALLISLAAAIMVTRSSSGSLVQTVPQQMFREPKVLMITAGLFFFIGFIPGMPGFLIIPLAILLFVGGYLQIDAKRGKKNHEEEAVLETFLIPPLEIKLAAHASQLRENLHNQLEKIRKEVGIHLGISMPAVHISDDPELADLSWAIFVKGSQVDSGRQADLHVLSQSLIKAIKVHAHALISREDLSRMLQEAKKYDRAVVDELSAKKLSLGQLLKIMQQLLKEGIPIINFLKILEILADHAANEKSHPDLLVEKVRQGLVKEISETFFGKNKKAHVITVDPKVEQILSFSKETIRAKTIEQLKNSLITLAKSAQQSGIRPIIVTNAISRAQLRGIIERELPTLPVLAYKEIHPDIDLIACGTVSNEVLI